MRREAADVVAGIEGVEGVQHQERIEALQAGAADDAGQAHAVAIRGGAAIVQVEDVAIVGVAHGAAPW
ncbi:hypothetical protein D3C71_2216460 [compost metagenome]